MRFGVLRGRLIEGLRSLVANGFYTERSLARCIGISQPQMHNILKGRRALTPEVADLAMERMSMSVLDLLLPEEVAEFERRKNDSSRIAANIPRKGPGISRESGLRRVG